MYLKAMRSNGIRLHVSVSMGKFAGQTWAFLIKCRTSAPMLAVLVLHWRGFYSIRGLVYAASHHNQKPERKVDSIYKKALKTSKNRQICT